MIGERAREFLETLGRMILVLAGLSLLFFVLWAYYSSALIIDGNRDPITVLPRTFGLEFTEEVFASADGLTLKGWFVPAQGPRAHGKPGPVLPTDKTLIVCHGWGANRSDILERTTFLNTEGGYNLFYFDFRNHGDSGSGKSSLTKLEIGDLEAALSHLRAAHPAEARRVALYGMSMGAAVCLWVAAQHPDIRGVAAESPFGSYRDVVIRFGRMYYNMPRVPFALITLWAVRWRLGFDPQDYSPLGVVGKIAPRPLFLLQGDKDARMPVMEGERLFAAAGEPKTLWTVPGANHGEVAEWGGRDYRQKLLDFYGRVFAPPAS